MSFLSLPLLAAPMQQLPSGAIILPPDGADDPTIRRAWANVLLEPQLQDEGSVVVVTGQATIQAEPDRARIYFSVETEGVTAREAGEDNADRMTAVTTALREAGQSVPGFRVETSSYALNPVYGSTRQGGPREIVGYVARNTLVVTIDEVEMVGTLIDAALGAGSNRMSSLQFEVSDPEPYRSEALREAIRVARTEAEVIAESLGMSLGSPIEVQGGANIPTPRPFMQSGAEAGLAVAQAMPTPIEAGLQTISARVEIRFRLYPTP